MMRLMTVLYLVLGIGLAVSVGQSASAKDTPLRFMMTESKPGTMSTMQYCLLVFTDHAFHAETANRKTGKDRDRRVYEGQLSEADWNALGGILDTKDFRELKVPRSEPPLMIENLHPYTISVARKNGFQNMEFLNDDGLKPYGRQVKPLLEWWKSQRSAHMVQSEAPPDSRCVPDSNKGLFSY